MARERKSTKEHNGGHRRRKTSKRIDNVGSQGLLGAPPTDNVRKHPDEVYGDTEIPERGAHLDRIKRESH